MTDSYQWDSSRTSRHYYIHFQVDRRVDTGRWPATRHWPHVAVRAPLFRQLVWLGDGDAGGTADPSGLVLARGYLWTLLALLLTGRVEGALPDRVTSERLEAAIEHICRRWEDYGLVSIGRLELAAAANVSVAHLSRLFTQEYGVGPVVGMEWVRLARAKALIQKSSMTLGSIAHACGFAEQYHFSHRFSATFGYPPSRLRTTADSAQPPSPPQMLTLERVLLSGP